MLLKVVFNIIKFKPKIIRSMKYHSTIAEEITNNTKHEIAEIDNPFITKKKQCILCKYNIEPDYKNVRLLSQFQSRHTGIIYPRNITGLCKAKQKKLMEEVIKAQTAGLMGTVVKNPEFVNDPELFDKNNPILPHAY